MAAYPAPGTALYEALSAIVLSGSRMTAGEVVDYIGSEQYTNIGLRKALSRLVAISLVIRGDDLRHSATAAATQYIERQEGKVISHPIVAPRYIPPFKPLTVSPFRTESPRGQKIEQRSYFVASRAE